MIQISPSFSWADLFKSVWHITETKRTSFFLAHIAVLLLSFYTILPPLLIGAIVDFFTQYKPGESLVPFYQYATFLGLSYSLVSFFRLATKGRLAQINADVVYEIRTKGFEKLIEQNLIESTKETAGSKLQKIQRGTESFSTLSRQMNNEIYSAIASVVGTGIVFLFINPKYTVFLIGYIIIYVSIIKYFYSYINKLQHEENLALESGSGAYVEGLHNILTIKAMHAQKAFSSHIQSKELIRKEYRYKITEIVINQWQAFQVFNGISVALFLYLIGKDVLAGLISIGSIVIFYGYLERLRTTASDLLGTYEHILDAKAGIGRMMTVLSLKTTLREGKLEFPTAWQTISLTNASFSYKKETDKLSGLRDLTLQIKRKSNLGIVGKTGSGKSTLAKILLGLYPLDSGEYAVDGVSFYDLKPGEISKHIGIVLQESEIFNFTLLDNITLMRQVDAELIQKAIKISQLEDVIENLPEGIDTLVGEKGYHLSGGERQRVGIARAICKNPKILIFDEATSSLDSKTEKAIQVALEKELKEKTLIFIAHRISTLENTDRILVFKNGTIIEEGTYQQLSENKDSHFYNLHKEQVRKD